jgi:hypothetical protein
MPAAQRKHPKGLGGACFVSERFKLEQPTVLIWGPKAALQGSN